MSIQPNLRIQFFLNDNLTSKNGSKVSQQQEYIQKR